MRYTLGSLYDSGRAFKTFLFSFMQPLSSKSTTVIDLMREPGGLIATIPCSCRESGELRKWSREVHAIDKKRFDEAGMEAQNYLERFSDEVKRLQDTVADLMHERTVVQHVLDHSHDDLSPEIVVEIMRFALMDCTRTLNAFHLAHISHFWRQVIFQCQGL